MKRMVIGAALLALLAGCGGKNGTLPPVQINKPVPVVRPQVAPMDLQDVHWMVKDLNGLRELINQMEATGQNNVTFYVLPQDEYNILAMNLAEMKRYISDQKASNDFLWKAIQTNASTPAKEKTTEAK